MGYCGGYIHFQAKTASVEDEAGKEYSIKELTDLAKGGVMCMNKEATLLKLKKAYLFPQNRKWVRILESVILILCSFMVTYQIIFWGNEYDIKLKSENFYWINVFCYLTLLCYQQHITRLKTIIHYVHSDAVNRARLLGEVNLQRDIELHY